MRSAATVDRKVWGAKLGMTTQVPPLKSVGSIINQVPLEYRDVVVRARDLSLKPISMEFETAQCTRARWLCTIPLGSPVVPEL